MTDDQFPIPLQWRLTSEGPDAEWTTANDPGDDLDVAAQAFWSKVVDKDERRTSHLVLTWTSPDDGTGDSVIFRMSPDA